MKESIVLFQKQQRKPRKPVYLSIKLLTAIKKAKQAGKNSVKTKFRSCTISPDMVGMIIEVYNGKKFIPVTITSRIIGHKLGEFSPTRVFPNHTSKNKK